MHLTHTETGQLFDLVKIAVGAFIGFTIAYYKDKASDRKAAAGQLHKDVNEFMAATGELQVTLAVLRENDSGRGRSARVLLFVMGFFEHGGHRFVYDRGDEGWNALLRAGAATSTDLMRWDRDAKSAADRAIVAPMARFTLAAATLRSSGDEQFNKAMITATDAVLALPQAYSKSITEWQGANDDVTAAIAALVKDAKRVTAARRWMGLRKAKE